MDQRFQHILLVEDDIASIFLIKELLQELQVSEKVEVVANGADALAYLEQHCSGPAASRPDLLLVDINMPVMDGLEFLEQCRQEGYLEDWNPRIIIITSSTYQKDLQKARQLGISGYLVKPVTKGALLFALQVDNQ